MLAADLLEAAEPRDQQCGRRPQRPRRRHGRAGTMTGPAPAAAVTLPPLPAPVDRLWHVLLDPASALRVP